MILFLLLFFYNSATCFVLTSTSDPFYTEYHVQIIFFRIKLIKNSTPALRSSSREASFTQSDTTQKVCFGTTHSWFSAHFWPPICAYVLLELWFRLSAHFCARRASNRTDLPGIKREGVHEKSSGGVDTGVDWPNLWSGDREELLFRRTERSQKSKK